MGISLMDLGYLSLALFFNTFTAPAVKITQSANGKYEVKLSWVVYTHVHSAQLEYV